MRKEKIVIMVIVLFCPISFLTVFASAQTNFHIRNELITPNLVTTDGTPQISCRLISETTIDVGDTLPYTGTNVVIRDTLLFILDYSYGLIIYDIANKSNPVLEGHLDFTGVPRGMSFTGNYVCISCAHGEFYVIEISDTMNPSIVGQTLLSSNGGYDCAVKGNYVYVGSESLVRIVNITVKNNPQEISGFGNSYVRELAIIDNYLVYSDSNAFVIMDISNETNPLTIDQVVDGRGASSLEYYNDFVYVSRPSFTRVINISDPNNIEIVDEYNDYANDLAYYNGYLYSAVWEGMTVLNVTNNLNITDTGTFHEYEPHAFIDVEENYAYLLPGAVQGRGLQILSVGYDKDGDGLNDYEETTIFLTDPENPDSDGDGFLDGIEVVAGTDPNNSADYPVITNNLSFSYILLPIGFLFIWGLVITFKDKR